MAVKRLLISGKVQAVFYRVSAKEMADRLFITGWVRNLPTGEVEAIISGTELQIQQFLEWAWKGPKKAVVNNIIVHQEPHSNFDGFRIK